MLKMTPKDANPSPALTSISWTYSLRIVVRNSFDKMIRNIAQEYTIVELIHIRGIMTKAKIPTAL